MAEEEYVVFAMTVDEYSLLHLLKKQPEIKQEDFWNNIYLKYDEFVDEIKDILNQCFPRIKSIDNYSDNFIANQIFKIQVMGKDLKALYKYSMIAILKEMVWLKEELKRFEHVDYCSDYFKGEMIYLWHIVFSIREFIETVQSYVQKENCRHHYSRRKIDSKEIAYLARRMPRFEYYFDDIAQGPVSIFLIRQQIELRIIEILGIMDITTIKDNSLVKVTPDKLLPILRKPQFTLPMEYRVIEKIHNWTNLYIHRAKIYDYWEMEWAIKTIQPFVFDQTLCKKSFKCQMQQEVYSILNDEGHEKYKIRFGDPDIEWSEE